jgi:hypothetical protein
LAPERRTRPMTWIIRNAFLALVAFATLAIMLMLAMSVEATDLTSGYSPSPSGIQISVR